MEATTVLDPTAPPATGEWAGLPAEPGIRLAFKANLQWALASLVSKKHLRFTCRVVTGACLGERTCEVYSGNSNFGDPCRKKRKFLRFTYE